MSSFEIVRGMICSVVPSKSMAFALNEAGEEVLLLESRRCAWVDDHFCGIDFTERSNYPPVNTIIKMEVEVREESGKLRAVRWAPVFLLEGTLKFFWPAKRYGFAKTPVGEVFLHVGGFRHYIDGGFQQVPREEQNLSMMSGTPLFIHMPTRISSDSSGGPRAEMWAVKPIDSTN